MRHFAEWIAAENGGPPHPVVLTATLAGRSVDGFTALAEELGDVGNFCESHGAIKSARSENPSLRRGWQVDISLRSERENDRLFSVVTHQKK